MRREFYETETELWINFTAPSGWYWLGVWLVRHKEQGHISAFSLTRTTNGRRDQTYCAAATTPLSPGAWLWAVILIWKFRNGIRAQIKDGEFHTRKFSLNQVLWNSICPVNYKYRKCMYGLLGGQRKWPGRDDGEKISFGNQTPFVRPVT
jgi:hypothetical protein